MIQTLQFCLTLYKKEAESLLIYLFLLLSSGKLQLPRFQQHNRRCITVVFVRRRTATLKGKMWLYDMLNSLYRPNSISRTSEKFQCACVFSCTWFAMHCQCFFFLERRCIVNQRFFFLEWRCIVKTERIVDQAWSLRSGRENKLVSLPVKMKIWWGDYRTFKSRR
jgi:hypothetical protein